MPPEMSLVVLAWNNLDLTKRCVDSLRDHTDVSNELIIVDNGSEDETAQWAAATADKPVLNDTNLGFSAGMNRGLEEASGEYVAFINNDTAFPAVWASTVIENFDDARVGIVAPAVTSAGNPVTVRQQPGTDRLVLSPFGELPSGVVYVMRTEVIRALGGWNESYPLATAEDLDLIFTVWCNDLEVICDTRVLVEHESQASLDLVEEPWKILRDNLRQFLDTWKDPANLPAQLPDTPDDIFHRNRRHAAAAASWLDRLVEERAKSRRLEMTLETVERTKLEAMGDKESWPLRWLRRSR